MSLSFLSVSGLWALLALAIPILIHLFNRSLGRLVRIGHIELVRQARRLKVTEVKLTQWLLLLLRMLIFVLMALLVAGLAQKGLQSSDTASTYVSPAWIQTAEAASLNKLLEQDSRILVLRPDFAPLDKKLAEDIRQTAFKPSGISNIWPLLSDRLSLEHHTGAIDVYAVDYLTQFGPSKANLPHDINWHIAHPSPKPVLDHRVLNAVIIYDIDRRKDASYIATALAAIKQQRIPGLTYHMTGSEQISQNDLASDWLFLLTEQALTSTQVSQINPQASVLMDAGKESDSGQQQWTTLPFYPFTNFSIDRLEFTDSGARLLGSTVNGVPVLQDKRVGNLRILQFRSRFNPSWNSLTLQPEFPEFLLQLMLGDEQQSHSFADARISEEWLQVDLDRYKTGIPLPRRSLQDLLAMLLALVWMTERWLSERKKREDH